MAIAAKQLGRAKVGKPGAGDKYSFPSVMQLYGYSTQVDWLYKAATYYDRAISSLQLYLRQALPGHETTFVDDNPPATSLCLILWAPLVTKATKYRSRVKLWMS
jgi:hypothetical protein